MNMYSESMTLGDLGGFKGGAGGAGGMDGAAHQSAENPRFRGESDDER